MFGWNFKNETANSVSGIFLENCFSEFGLSGLIDLLGLLQVKACTELGADLKIS